MKQFNAYYLKIGAVAIFLALVILLIYDYVTSNHSNALDTSTTLCTTFPNYLTLEEAPSGSESMDQCFWVDSGALFFVKNKIGSTIVGEIDKESRWKSLYKLSAGEYTDKGTHPQNIFRLINKKNVQDVREELLAYIENYHLSTSSNRDKSNGIFLLARYHDSQNLYLGGIRVDGNAVIKKKSNGVYQTLGIVSYDNRHAYDRTSNPNILPVHTWIGIAVEVKNQKDHSTLIDLDLSFDQGTTWNRVLSVVDRVPEPQLYNAAATGIRSDFMDLYFKNYKVITTDQGIT